jgi:hypothetical protein
MGDDPANDMAAGDIHGSDPLPSREHAPRDSTADAPRTDTTAVIATAPPPSLRAQRSNPAFVVWHELDWFA